MKKGMRSNADGVLEKKRRSQKWKRLAGVLGCLVVIVTAYVLMRPAETLERELICGMEEHQHSVEQGCYQEIAAEPAQPICGMEEAGHVHSEECYSAVSVLTCTEPEGDGHQHDESCYTMETTLICELPEAEGHTHTAECYPAGDAEATPELELVCELPEHTHTEDCYADDAAQHAQVEEVAALIDALPSAEEVEARLEELLAAEDAEAYDAYCAELARQVEQANTAYEALTDEQKAQLNIDKLTALFVYLPAKEGTFTLTAPATESGIVVTISGETASLPFPVEELTLTAVEVEDENANALRDEALESEELTAAENYMLDIRLMHGEEKVQPTGPITVTFAGLPLDGGADAALVDDVEDNADTDAEPVAYQAQKMAAQAVVANAADDTDMSDETTDDTADDAGESYVTGPKVYQIDEGTQQATEIDVAVNEENNVVLETEQLTNLYSVSLLAANGNITTAAALKTACEAGGTVVLGKDISVADTITIGSGKNTTLDLKGYKITFTNGTKNAKLFHVTGGSLTIVDSTANADGTSKKESRKKRNGITYAEGTPRKSLATISGGNLTYYIVDSVETDTTKHLTTETQWQRTVQLGAGRAGAIVGAEKDGQVAILQESGTVTIRGGYICGFGKAKRPGPTEIDSGSYDGNYNSAITISGGTFNLEGGVLAANRAYNHGGAIYMDGQASNLIMTGGIISGNYIDRKGGGIYASCKSGSLSKITLSGNAYITCNTANGYVKSAPGGYSAGGLYLGSNISFTMTGGYITGNYGKGDGGGIKASGTASDPNLVNIYGGYISANKCEKVQGGGICCNSYSTCKIEARDGNKIYITNNQMMAENMFGGGGIYIGHNCSLHIYNTLISENTAKHIGGGFGGCFVSNTFVFLDKSVAIFDNYDGGANGQPRDSDAAKDKTNFNYTGPSGNPDPYPISRAVDGHQDVYMGGNSRIYAGMLGGGDPKWSGSCDGSRITLTNADQYCTSGTVIGLTAHPSDDDKTNARNAANVYITGNYAARYGGGIMSNGTVYFGIRPTEKTLPTRLTLVGKKSFLQKDGKTAAAIADGRFTITVTNTNDASEVYTGTVDSSGNITFPTMLFQSKGTKTYKIQEFVNPVEGNITYDTTTYTMTVTLAERWKIGTSMGGTSEEFEFPTTVKIVNDKTKATVFSATRTEIRKNSTVILRSTPSGGAAFTNQLKNEEYTLDIVKQDAVTGKGIGVATFEMQTFVMDPRPVGAGKQGTGKEMYIGMYCVKVKDGVYRYAGYSWKSGMPQNIVRKFDTDTNGKLLIIGLPAGKYQMREIGAPEGYQIAEQWGKWNDILLNATEVSSGTKTITVADPPATYIFQFLKVSEADKTKPVPNAKYQLLDSTGQEVKFTKAGTEYQYSTSGTVTELITDKDGRFQLTGLPRGSYTLREIEAPAGFGLADDYSFELSPEKTVDQVFTYTQEEPVVYELPETGGGGAKPYIVTGAALLVGAVCLMVCRDKRRKAGGRTF